MYLSSDAVKDDIGAINVTQQILIQGENSQLSTADNSKNTVGFRNPQIQTYTLT